MSRLISGRTCVGAPDNFERIEAIIERLEEPRADNDGERPQIAFNSALDIYVII
jgi:hypothetical protein